MATINKLMVGESLVGEGNEVAHIDLIMGPRGRPSALLVSTWKLSGNFSSTAARHSGSNTGLS